MHADIKDSPGQGLSTQAKLVRGQGVPQRGMCLPPPPPPCSMGVLCICMGPMGLAPAFGYIYQTWTLERGKNITR
jgi:hypothetical protein